MLALTDDPLSATELGEGKDVSAESPRDSYEKTTGVVG